MAESTLQGGVLKDTAPSPKAVEGDAEKELSRGSQMAVAVLRFVVVLALLFVVWEGVKFIGGNPWNFSTADGAIVNLQWKPPLSIYVASDLNLPHVWDIFAALVRPAQRNGPPLIAVLFKSSLFTLQEAFVGFVIGAVLGLVLAIIFVHSSLLERGLVPYVVASQTVPILAIAPMVIVWLKAGWWSVAIIAAYLTFFPVTINTLRGLRSPDPRSLELMRSYAAERWTILWKLRFPSSLPYLFTALKISATTSVVAAIIGELPSGMTDGLGGAILNYSQYYVSGPPKLWATILISAVLGILFYLVIVAIEALVVHNNRKSQPAS